MVGNNPYSYSGPMFVLSQEGELCGLNTPGNREIVRRIHACLSACEGLSTDELERGIVSDMRRVIAQVIPVLQDRRHSLAASAATIIGMSSPSEELRAA